MSRSTPLSPTDQPTETDRLNQPFFIVWSSIKRLCLHNSWNKTRKNPKQLVIVQLTGAEREADSKNSSQAGKHTSKFSSEKSQLVPLDKENFLH